MSDSYENFRTILTMNLCSVIEDPDLIQKVLSMVDISMNDFEISKKQMEIIPVESGIPEVVKHFLAAKAIANLSKSTLKQYRCKLTDFFNTINKSYMDVQPNDVRIYLYSFKQERNASECYMDSVRVTLNTFFQWCVNNDYLIKNPCSKIEKIKFQYKRREPLTPIQLETIRWNATDVRTKAVIDFFYSTGCRVSECADVRLSDINWEDRSVRIRHGKGDKERMVYFNAESEQSIKEYLKTRTDDTDALFVSSKEPHNQLKAHSLQDIVKKVSKSTGIHVYPHKLRHTFATAGLRGGIPLEKLQALMGHTKPETTLIYAKQNNIELQTIHQRVYT